MATLTTRVADLEAWKAAHVAGHVLSGHLTNPTAHGHPHPAAVPPPVVIPPPAPVPVIVPPPVVVPAPLGKVVTVPSIVGLKAALADDTVDEIVVVNGTYVVAPAGSQAATSLWIGAAYAGRTRPVIVRAAIDGGVTFDGGGATYFGGLTFVEGAHHQTWGGFRFANGTPTQTGVIVFGGYPGLAAPHHITLREFAIAGSIRSTYAGSGDHAVYFSQAVGGPHDILIDGYTVDGAGGVNTALTFYHSDATNQNAWNVTVRRMVSSGTYEAIELWDPTLRDILIEDVVIRGARSTAVRYESGAGILLRRVVSTGSREHGFYSSKGIAPPGITFVDCSLA